MTKCIACVFTNASYGNVISQEGLDISLSVSVLFDQVGIFFISDGIFLLLSNQKPNKVANKNFILNFEVLSLCGVHRLYLCADSAFDRGIRREEIDLILQVTWLSSYDWYKELSRYDLVLGF